MSIEDVTAELQALIDGRRANEAEPRLAELARDAYEHRGELLATYRCAIRKPDKTSCGKRAGHIFDTPLGLIFVDSSAPEGDGGKEWPSFIYESGLLFVSAPGIFAPAPVLIAGAPFARCGRHGPFPAAAIANSYGRDIRELLGDDYSKRGRIVVYRALDYRPGGPINGPTGQLGTDMSHIATSLLNAPINAEPIDKAPRECKFY